MEASAEADAAELVERRAGAKGNAHQQSTYWALNQARVSQALERIRQLCRHTPEVGAVCGKAARTVLCGGRDENRVPTATRRREFITLIGGAAVAWPLAARAQQAGKLPTIGFSGGGTPLTESQRVAAFVQRLRELGWTEGRNVAIEYRWLEGRNERSLRSRSSSSGSRSMSLSRREPRHPSRQSRRHRSSPSSSRRWRIRLAAA